MAVPYTFAGATSSIPLAQLDTNFATTFTLGNTAIQLGNTVTTLNNMTLANVTISSGNVTITNVSVTTANVTTGNVTTLTSTNATLTNMSSGNVTITGGTINGTSLGASTASTANVTTLSASGAVTLSAGTANGVAYLDGSKVVTTGSALSFDGTNLGVGTAIYGNAGAINAAIGVPGVTPGGLQLWSSTTGTHYVQFGDDTVGDAPYRGAVGYNHTVDGLLFLAAGSEQMRLTSVGLGIGTSSPGNKLGISGVATTYAASASIALYDTISGVPDSRNWLIGNVAAGNYGELNFAVSSAPGGAPTISKMTLDSAGNLGLGVTPSAWSGFGKTMEFNNAGCYVGNSGATSMQVGANNYFNGSNYIYSTSNVASRYAQSAGSHLFFTAPSGTAGNAISFTQALTLDANRNLLLNGTTAGASAVGTLAIFNGTAPTGSVTDGIILYAEDVSSSSELKVRDEAGNVTTLSPHNFSLIPEGPSEDMAWAYYSEKGGKRINVDMLKLARMVEKLTGEKLVYETP